MANATNYRLHRDPIYYVTVGFFALITTGLPAVLGQPRFMPLAQAVALTVFLFIPLRQRDLRSALNVVFLWLALQVTLLVTLTWFAPVQIERAFDDGFLYRTSFAEWYFANSPLPASFATQPLPALVEILGLLGGSLLTGGLVGVWFLVRMANLAAFGAGSLLLALESPLWLPVALPPWSLLQLAGGAGLVVLLAEPLASGGLAAGLRHLAGERRRPLLTFGALYLAGLLLELVLPAFWHFYQG